MKTKAIYLMFSEENGYDVKEVEPGAVLYFEGMEDVAMDPGVNFRILRNNREFVACAINDKGENVGIDPRFEAAVSRWLMSTARYMLKNE